MACAAAHIPASAWANRSASVAIGSVPSAAAASPEPPPEATSAADRSLLGLSVVFDGHPCPTYGTYKDPEWVGLYVCDALGITDHNQALDRIPAEEKGVVLHTTPRVAAIAPIVLKAVRARTDHAHQAELVRLLTGAVERLADLAVTGREQNERARQLGLVLYKCECCGEMQAMGRSCGDRHCPACQRDKAETWLEKQTDRLLPCPYFLVTFTLPAAIRDVARSHQRVVYSALFEASSEALRAFPHRFQDERGVEFWSRIMAILETVEAAPASLA